jgi:hypothetical protein
VPVVAENTVFITTVQKALVPLGGAYYNDARASLGFGDHELVVPNGTQLTRFREVEA